MHRIEAVVDLLDSHAGSRLRPGRPADDALLELLGHMAIRDDVFDEAEIELLSRVRPEWNVTTLNAWLGRVASQPLDLPRLAGALTTDDERWTALRFACRMALADGHLDEEELALLESLAEALSMPPRSVHKVLAEAHAHDDAPTPDAIEAALSAVQWDAVTLAPGDVQSADLLRVRPDDVTPVRRVGVDGAEVLGIYAEGVVARFLEGSAWLDWDAIVGSSRGAGLESSVRLHTEDGRTWSLVDARMAGLMRVLDRLRAPEPTPASARPEIEQVRVGAVDAPDDAEDA